MIYRTHLRSILSFGIQGTSTQAEPFTFINRILPVLDSVPVNQLTQQFILRFFLKRYSEVSQSTRNRYIRYLKTIFTFGVNQEFIDKNPLARWKATKEKPRQSMLTVKQAKEIKKHAVPHIAWMVDVAFNLGVRTGPSELLALRWDWIDWDNMVFRIYAIKTKSWRQVPITEQFAEKLCQKQKEAKTDFIIPAVIKLVMETSYGKV